MDPLRKQGWGNRGRRKSKKTSKVRALFPRYPLPARKTALKDAVGRFLYHLIMKPFPIVSEDIYLELFAVYSTEYSLEIMSPRTFDAF